MKSIRKILNELKIDISINPIGSAHHYCSNLAVNEGYNLNGFGLSISTMPKIIHILNLRFIILTRKQHKENTYTKLWTDFLIIFIPDRSRLYKGCVNFAEQCINGVMISFWQII